MKEEQFLLDTLASKHLGKTSDGSTMQRYTTPTSIDSSLLVPLPRELNRTSYDITVEDFVGFDRWNCYEVSALLNTGFPVSGQVVLVYHSDSPFIVESKSLKLYLNSFNMHKFDTSSMNQIGLMIEHQIYEDFKNIGINLGYISFNNDIPELCKPNKGEVNLMRHEFTYLENVVDKHKAYVFSGENPNILQTRNYNKYYNINNPDTLRWTSASLRSNCRVTNQPDWGNIYIAYKPHTLTVTTQSLFEYIISLRTESHFHEEICEVVYKRLKTLLNPVDLLVACNYTRRGGIDINPLRASSFNVINEEVHGVNYFNIKKEPRQ